MINEKILNKVKKLLALHDNNPSVNESAAAFKAAQKLLAEHRLSMADLNLEEDSDEEEIQRIEDPLFVGKNKSSWRGLLSYTLAKINNCRTVWYGGTLKVVGRESDFDIVKWMFNSISSQIDTITKRACKGKGKGFSNDFRLGAVTEVSRRLKEAHEETSKKYQGTQALVKVNRKDEEVQEYLDNMNLSKAKPLKLKLSEAYIAGKHAGKKVTLSRGALSN